MIVRLFAFIIDHPRWVLALLLVATVVAGLQLPKLKLVTDLKSLLPHDSIYENDERIRDTFLIKNTIIVGLVSERDVFTVTAFTYLKNLIAAIEPLDGVFTIRSLFSEDNISATPERFLDISPFLKRLDAQSIEQAKQHIRNFSAVREIFVAEDFSAVTFLVELEDSADKSGIYFAIKNILAAAPPPPGSKIVISGMPVCEGVLGNYMLDDFILMIPIVAAIIIVLLYCTYRSVLLVVLSFIMIFVVDIWTLGFMAYMGAPLYIIQCVMPVILMALSVADEIHIFGRYYEECRNSTASNREKVLAVMGEMWRPVILTSVTTAFGFFALITTSIKPLKYFGIYTAFGIMAAMVFALLATPVILVLFGKKASGRPEHRFLDAALVSLGNLMFRHKALVLSAILALAVLSVAGMSQVFIQDSWISNFKKTSVVYTDDLVLNRKLAGTNILYLELDTGTQGGIKNPDFLEKVAQFQQMVKTLDGVGGSVSLVQIIKKMNHALRGTYEIPASSEALAQYMLLLEGSSYERLWDYDYQRVNVIVFFGNADYITGTTTLPAIDSYIKKNLPEVKASKGGEVPLSFHWVNFLRTDQLKSFLTALLLIFIVSLGLFRSFKKALVVTAPIVLAVAMNFGILGFLNIPMSVSISIFSSIIMGIGIDYAIHLQTKFDVLSLHVPPEKLLPDIYTSAGKAVFWNAVVVMGGFLTLGFSNMPSNQKLGLICSLGITTSLIASFLIVPLLFKQRPHP